MLSETPSQIFEIISFMRYRRPCLFSGFILCFFVGGVGRAQNLPDGKGKAQFMRVCGDCHGVDVVIKISNTPDGWAAVVDDMVSRGAQGTQDDFDLVSRYLAANFGPKVNVNKATEKELSMVLGLSSDDARAIVHYRETLGNFKDWGDLEKVPHIDMKKLESERTRIDFSGNQAASRDTK
jgi:competence ComEA-like helix-hairpin-helix protein